MTDVQEAIKQVESTEEFKHFRQQHPHAYIVHVFAQQDGKLELGYYAKDTDKVTVFKTNPFAMMPAEDMFKTRDHVEELVMREVMLGFKEGLEKAKDYAKQAYANQQIIKSICVLQYERPIWNITFVTSAMQMINVKVNATNGELVSRTMHSIMELAKD